MQIFTYNFACEIIKFVSNEKLYSYYQIQCYDLNLRSDTIFLQKKRYSQPCTSTGDRNVNLHTGAQRVIERIF